MSKAQMFAAATQGLANVAQYERERPEREMRAQEAKMRQQMSMQQLQEYQQQAPLRKSQAELALEQNTMQLRDEQAKRLRNETFSSFDMYEADSDPRHLNNFLRSAKANPAGRAMWSQWVRFDPLTRTPETEAMLGQAGITDVNSYFSDPELVKSKVLGTDQNGQRTLLDMNKLYQATGYAGYTDARTLEALQARAQIENLMKGPQSAETNMIAKIAEERGISTYEAAKEYFQLRNSGKSAGSSIERIAAELREQNPNLSYEESIRQAARTSAGPSTTEKDIGVTAGVRQQLHDLAGGNFYDLDLTDSRNRAKAGELIVDLEHATGRRLSDATKRIAKDLRSLSALGATAGSELTPDETGIIDNMLYSVGKYINNNVEGVNGVSAYETFRNVFRNALYGASLTATEVSAFEKAAGNLKQQLGPVLAQLKTQMVDVKNQLQSIADFEDPMVAYYYLGQSQDDVLSAVQQIERRIELMDEVAAKRVNRDEAQYYPPRITDPAKPTVTVPVTKDGATPQRPLSEVWGEL